MAGIVKNKRAFLNTLKGAAGEARRSFSTLVKTVVWTLHYEITALTPVWSGEALSNFRWSVGSPDRTAIFGVFKPIEPTNQLPLGTEQNRPAAQAQVDFTVNRLNFSDPYRVFYMTNNDPTSVGLEFGELPKAPFRQRSPNGMVGLSVRYVVERLEHGSLV